ncbi:MAG: hypothetical protein SFX73_17725 [Kofleriaceae bacterium]|nr:hypothetical protein [Kofleriaceae bacterium]
MARRIALTVAVLPLIVLVGLRSAWAAYACSMDGQVRETCCCPKKPDSKRSPSDGGAAHIEARDCCDVTRGAPVDGVDAREADRLRPLDASVLAIVPTAFVAPAMRPALTRPRAPLARPPPRTVLTYLANCSILR